MVFVDQELRDVEFHRPDFVVHVNFGEVVGTVQPLSGVNKGVRAAPGSCDISAATEADYSSLYTALGVQSVRPHEGGYNISQLLVPPRADDVSRPIETVGGVGIRDYPGGILRTFTEDQLQPPFGYDSGNIGPGTCGGRNLALQDDAAVAYPETPYFHWYPTLFSPLLFQLNAEQYLDLTSLGTQSGYRGLADAGLEIHFRLGEGSKGPGYIGHPELAETESTDARRCYAQLAARIVRDLAEGCSPETVPGFIDLWNEAFTGPFHASDSSAQLDLPLWAADYASFFDEVYDALASPGFPFVPFGAQILRRAERDGYLQRVEPGSGVDLSGVRFGGFSFLGGDMRTFALQMLSEPALNSRVFELLSALDDPTRLSFVSFHLYGIDDDHRTDGPFDIFDDLSRILRALDVYHAQQGAPYDGLNSVHLTEWGYRLPEDDDSECESVFGGSFDASMLTWMQYAQSVYDLNVERAHLWGGRGRKTGIVSFGHLVRSALPGAPPEDLFFIRASAVALLFHASVEGWELCMPRVAPGGSILGSPGAAFEVFDAAEQRLDVTALAARSEVVMGSPAYTVILSNLTEGSKQLQVTLSGLSPNSRYSLVVSRTNETALERSESFADADSGWSGDYLGHSVPADTILEVDGITYHALSPGAVSAAISDVVVEEHDEVVSDGYGTAILDVEFPADHGVMKLHLIESSRVKQASQDTAESTKGRTGADVSPKDVWIPSDSTLDDSENVVPGDSRGDTKDEG